MSTTKAKRTRWTEADARRVLNECAASGETVAEFSKRRGLSSERLYRWRRTLERNDNVGAPGFAEVTGVSGVGAGGNDESDKRLEVIVGGGRRIAVPNGFDVGELRRLLGLLEEAGC